ncbi:radical SAM protein [bacterium]|nr:radical SAM protein [bacterium]
MGTREVIVSGEGEPLLHPRLFDILASLKKREMTIQLFTNGTLIDETMAAALLSSGVDTLKVSLWAGDPDEYRRCYPGVDPDNFEKTKQGIAAVTRLKTEQHAGRMQVIMTGPLNRYNFRGMEGRIALACELGCDGVAFAPYKHWSGEFAEAQLSPDDITALTRDLLVQKRRLETAGLSHNIDDLLLQYRLGEDSWNTMPCYAGWYAARIRADGEVMPCCRCYLPLGNLEASSFNEIWNGTAYRHFRTAAIRRPGLAAMQGACACQWCLWAVNNHHTHRLVTRLVPGAGRRWSGNRYAYERSALPGES